MSSTPKSAPRNNSPDNETPDNSTPDDSTPDNADGSPESSKSPPSPPPPSESSPSPPPPSGNSPPPPSGNSPPPPSGNSPPPPSGSSKTPSPPPRTQGNSNSSVPSPPSSGRSSGSSSSRGQNSTASQTPSLASSSDSGRSSDSELGKRAIIGGVVGVGTFFIILVLVCFICRKKKRKQVYYYGDHALGKGSGYYNNAPPGWQGGPPVDHVMRVQNGMGHGGGWGGAPPAVNSAEMSSNYSGGPPLPPPSPNIMGLNQGTFTYDELAAATNGFTEANLIGQGGFGFVHKGVLPNGKEVAVKSLKANSGQGEREFQAEIEIISRVHHRHLVSLVGYCILGQQRMLVYEFVPNKTLEYHLHGKGQGVMDWPSRLRIALGSAKGLAYLHEDCHPRIIHRDIKAANVLIDDSFEAKVADFGLAKLTNDNNTHVSTRVMGTFGYLAPEYAQSGKLTEKSDVFSFGVMLLELITGRRPVDPTNVMEDSLVDWARPLLTRGLEEGNFNELADPFLEGNYNNEEMARMAASAAASIRHSGRKRPKMSQIVRALEGDVQLDDLNEGMKPGQSSIYGADSSYDTAQYQIDMKKIRMTALSSQEFNSSSSNDSREQTPNQRY